MYSVYSTTSLVFKTSGCCRHTFKYIVRPLRARNLTFVLNEKSILDLCLHYYEIYLFCASWEYGNGGLHSMIACLKISSDIAYNFRMHFSLHQNLLTSKQVLISHAQTYFTLLTLFILCLSLPLSCWPPAVSCWPPLWAALNFDCRLQIQSLSSELPLDYCFSMPSCCATWNWLLSCFNVIYLLYFTCCMPLWAHLQEMGWVWIKDVIIK